MLSNLAQLEYLPLYAHVLRKPCGSLQPCSLSTRIVTVSLLSRSQCAMYLCVTALWDRAVSFGSSNGEGERTIS